MRKNYKIIWLFETFLQLIILFGIGWKDNCLEFKTIEKQGDEENIQVGVKGTNLLKRQKINKGANYGKDRGR
jgi:hypothetical protein